MNERRRRDEGTALLVVVAMIAVLAPLVIHFHGRAADRLRLAARTTRHDQALALARGGIHLVCEVLEQDRRPYFFMPHHNPTKPVETEGRPSDLEKAYLWMDQSRETPAPFENGTWRVDLEDDQGRMALNRAPATELAALLQSLGVLLGTTSDVLQDRHEVDRSREMAAAIVDWRDTDTVSEGGVGAENDEYLRRSPPYRCRNGCLHAVGELSLIRDLDGPLLAKARLGDFVTIFGPGYHVNVNTAPAVVLAALPGLHGSADAAGTVAELIRNRPYRNLTDVRSAVAGTQNSAWIELFRHITLNTNRYRLTVTATVAGTEAAVEAVLQKQGRSFLVLSWKER